MTMRQSDAFEKTSDNQIDQNDTMNMNNIYNNINNNVTGDNMSINISSKNTDTPFRLGYVTDVEGNIEYFLSYVKKSQVLNLDLDNNQDFNPMDLNTCQEIRLNLKDNCYFVYGGDVVDKGPGDIRLTRALVDLKRRFPDRVFLLVGNRDLNKIRFSAELSKADMELEIDDVPPPFWDRNAPTLRTFLSRNILKREKKEQDIKDEDPRNENQIQHSNTRVNRLKYMLQHTLGCPDTFEFRREELAILQQSAKHKITDEQVLESFLYEIENRNGSLRQYLELSNVAVIVGNTLFAHGAVDRNTAKFVPKTDTKFEIPSFKSEPAKICNNVQSWVHGLNEYLKFGLEDYALRPYWDKDDTHIGIKRTSRGGEALLALQNRPAMWGRSIVSNCYGDGGVIITHHALSYTKSQYEKGQNDPIAFEGTSSDPSDPLVISWLLENGIRRVIVGHKPTGDCPAVLSASVNSGVEIVSADTSFSDIQAENNRGKAISVVELVGENEFDNQLCISGILRNGQIYQSLFNRLYGKDNIDDSIGDVKLGTMLNDGWWIKASTQDNQNYRLCRGTGRNVEFQIVSKDDLHQLIKENYSDICNTRNPFSPIPI